MGIVRRRSLGVLGVGLALGAFSGACGGSGPKAAAPAPLGPPSPDVAAPALPGEAAKVPLFASAGDCRRAKPGVGAVRLGDGRQSGPVALAQAGSGAARRVLAYVADGDEPVVHTVDVGSGREIAVTMVRGVPEHVMVLGDGRVVASLRNDGAIEVLEPNESPEASLTSRCVVGTPTEPVAMAATPDDGTVLVTSGWGRALTAYEASGFGARFQADLPREPRTVVVSDDGKRAFVAHVVNATLSVVDLEGGDHKPRAVDLKMKQLIGSPSGTSNPKIRSGCQGFALTKAVESTPEGLVPAPLPGERPQAVAPPPPRPAQPGPVPSPKPVTRPAGRLFAPFVTVDPGEPTRASSGYGNSQTGLAAEVSSVSVIDAGAERSLTRSLMGVPANRGETARAQADCILPRAAAYASGSLYVACVGNDALVEYDARGADPARAELRRWALPSGPTGVAIEPSSGRAVVYAHFSHQLALVPLRDEAPVLTLALSRRQPSPERAAFERGRVLFHRTNDPGVSRDGRACASCHPDGREDALTWSTPEGPRQTLMLAGRLKRQTPFSWSGANSSVEEHVRHTFQRLEGQGLPEGDLADLLTYVSAMGGPSDERASADSSRKQLIERGREVFSASETACSSCHPGGGTDGKAHDVGSRSKGDQTEKFATPSLRFLKGTAPYFHDGRYATLQDMLDATDGGMGHTLHLSRDDRAALAAYLETL